MSVAVLGAGAFGTALAIALARENPVTLWGRDRDYCAEMAAVRENTRRLPGAAFPKNLTISPVLETVLAADVLLIALPMQALSGFMGEVDLRGNIAVACCKGMDLQTGNGPTALLQSARHSAILTGPSFAQDIAHGQPTALALACADDQIGATLQAQLATSLLRLYRTTDVTGAEIGGALKNVMAIACGAVMGAGLGESARASLMTRGFAEMQRLAVEMGAQPETLMGLSGFGDLVLTCTSEQSRNYRYGHALGSGARFDPNVTVEGAATAQAFAQRARQMDLPIAQAVADLVAGQITVSEAMARLMARPLRPE